MENRKISYITIISDLYLLVGLSFIIYGFFFGIERIGYSSFNFINISKDIAIIIGILEIAYCIITSIGLYSSNRKIIRYSIMILSFIVVIYRIVNLVMLPSIFTGYMLLVGFILVMQLIFY